jgi:hypothetical protein
VSTLVFLGPSLPVESAKGILAAEYLPPVSQGDVYRAVRRGARVIGIVDGYFERVPAVWHKEILWAMAQGVHVFGAASMGALRAAELSAFGMAGVGGVFESFRDGLLEDDDEVTVIHGPAQLGYIAASEAMVNIRATLARALAVGIVSAGTHDALTSLAKSLYYPRRGYPRILELAKKARLKESELQAFAAWLPQGRVDRKREDALAMLRSMAEFLHDRPEPKRVAYAFEHTDAWEQVTRTAGHQIAAAVADPLPVSGLLDELRLDAGAYRQAMAEALGRALALREAGRMGSAIDPERFRETLHAFFTRRNLIAPQSIAGWMAEQRLDNDGLSRLVQNETRIGLVGQMLAGEILSQLPDTLRVLGLFGQLAQRGEQKKQWLEANGQEQCALAESGLGEQDLLEWFFTVRLGEAPIPLDLDAYAVGLGFKDRYGFLQLLLREHKFFTAAGSGGDSLD